jgi:outer membrane lipoprotein-sorting protein
MIASVMLLLLSVVADEKPEATFKKMDETIRKADSFQTEFSIAVKGDFNFEAKGKLVVASGNRTKLEVTGTREKEQFSLNMVSDGKKMQFVDDNWKQDPIDTKPDLNDTLLGGCNRIGIFSLFYLAIEVSTDKPKMKLEETMPVSDIKAGGAEATAPTLEYDVKLSKTKKPTKVQIWIDPKTHFPTKRVVMFKEGEKTITITETYTNSSINAKIDPKVFELK